MKLTLLFVFLAFIYKNEVFALESQVNSLIALLHKSQKINFSIPEGDNPLQDFQQLANQFKTIPGIETTEKPWKVHIPVLEQLAETYLTLSALLPNLDENRLAPFFQDLNDAKNLKSANYQWFLTFIDALSIANTNKNHWFSDKNNTTLFDTYRAEIIRQTIRKQSFIDPVVYRKVIRSIGNTLTRKFATTWAISKLFPKVVILPYPYALSDEDIVMSLPTPANASWLAGFSLGTNEKIDADGESMPRGKFFFHDILHFVIYRSGLSVYSTTLNYYHPYRSFDYIPSIRSLFFDCISVAQHMVQKTKKELGNNLNLVDNSQQNHRLTSLFSFLLLHETRFSAYQRLKAFIYPESAQIFFLEKSENGEFVARKPFLNPRYYGPLLPFEWKKDNAQTLKENFSTFYFSFSKNFKDTAQEIFPHKNLIQDIENLVSENNLFFDASIYHLFGSFEVKAKLETSFWDTEIRTGIIHAIKPSQFKKNFNEYYLNQDFLPSYMFRYWYFDLMRVTKEEKYKDAPDLTEQFIKRKNRRMILEPDALATDINASIDNHQNTKLIRAIASKNLEEVKSLIKLGACVNKANCFGESPLLWASIVGDEEILSLLLENKADVTAINSRQETALHLAIIHEANECINVLRHYKFCLEQRNYRKRTPIQEALTQKNKPAFEQILPFETNINQQSKKDKISVFMETMVIFPDLALKMLDSHHVDVNLLSKNGLSPLFLAFNKNNLDLFEALIRHGADLYHPNAEGWLVSHQAVISNRHGIIQILAQHNFDFYREVFVQGTAYGASFLLISSLFGNNNDFKNAETLLKLGLKDPKTLIYSIETGNRDALELLLKNGHDSFIKNNEQFRYFFRAAKEGQKEILQTLIDRGFSIPMEDLNQCLDEDNISAFEQLLFYKPNLNEFISGSDETLLARAAFFNRPLFVQLLINNGADINFPPSSSKTPLYCAVLGEHPDMVKLLLSLGADPNQPVEKTDKPLLTRAITTGNVEIIEALLKKGGHELIDQSRSEILNHNVLIEASSSSNFSLFPLLLDYGADLTRDRKVAFYSKNSLNKTEENLAILNFLVSVKNLEAIKLCLKHKINLEKKSLLILLDEIKNQEIIDLLNSLYT